MQPLTGVAFKVLSAFLFTVMSAIIKLVSDIFPTGQIVFARSFFALVPVIVMLAWRRELELAVKSGRPGAHIQRAVVGVTTMFGSFAALAYLPLPDVTAIGYASPLITVVLAVVLLKERVRIYRWTAVGVGLLGVLIVLWPHLGGGMPRGREAMGALLALA
ncbi:MAG: DMT family transporter, partial [Pseudomonadota bacterium]|nr:DMT family transporter [Pseudomonadota bacterium]